MSTKERLPITYHVEFFPTYEKPDRAQFDRFLTGCRIDKQEEDYVVFSSDESRIVVIRECDKAPKKSFYYALAFERDGGFYIKTHPDTAKRRMLSLDEGQESDLNIVLDALGETLSLKAKVHKKLNM